MEMTEHEANVSLITTDLWNSSVLVTNARDSGVPDGCVVFHWEQMEYVPWDNEQSLVSAETEQHVRRVKDVIVIPLMFLIGGPGNVINMIIFYKQGLRERVNLCLFALALADGVYLLFIFIMYGEQLYFQFTTLERYGPVMSFLLNYNVVTLFGLGWVSQILSAVLASERCLCVLSPLKSHSVLKTRTMLVVVVVIYASVLGLYSVVVFKYRIGCYYDPLSGTTFMNSVVGDFYRAHSTLLEYLDSFVYGAGITVFSCIVVVATTAITTFRIRKAAAWRASTSSSSSTGGQSGSIPQKDLVMTRMLIAVSIFFLICVSPIAIVRFIWLFLPEIQVNRRQHNLFLVSLWLLETVSYTNSAFNIVIYYTMGSRYRETLWTLCGRSTRFKRDKDVIQSSITELTGR